MSMLNPSDETALEQEILTVLRYAEEHRTYGWCFLFAEQIFQRLSPRLQNLLRTTYTSPSHTAVGAIALRAKEMRNRGLVEIAWMDTAGLLFGPLTSPQEPSTPRLELYRLKATSSSSGTSSTGASDTIVTDAEPVSTPDQTSG